MVKTPRALYAIPLCLALFAASCKEKSSGPSETPGKPTVLKNTATGKRWVWSSDGVMLREAPTREAKALGLITRGTEIEILSDAPVADTVSGDTGHWVKADTKGKQGWVFDAFLSAPLPAGALELGVKYTLKAEEFIPEQFFTFAADGTAKYVRNHCEGYDARSDKFTVIKGQIHFKEETALKLEIHGRTSLLLPAGADEFTCNNVTGAAHFEIPPKK